MAAEIADVDNQVPPAVLSEQPRPRWIAPVARWLFPLVGIAWALWASYAAIANRRFGSANGVPGELLPGQSIGQSFIARYTNLSGIEVNIGAYREGRGPLRASLILHLRQAPQPDASTSNSPGASPDLATVRLPAGQEVEENPWYLFSFPPIGDSQDQAFYVEIESPDGKPGNAVTLFWWLPTNGVGDPYPYGSAYLNGRPHAGDLTFGLHYSPSPLDAWAQLARAASANVPGGLMVIILIIVAAVVAVVAGVVWVALRLPLILRHPVRRNLWLKRWSLPVVLVVALFNGLLYMFLTPPWQGPDEHSHFTYAAIFDRLDLDDRRVQAPDMRTAAEAEKLQAAVSASMDRHQFTRYVAWHSAPGAPVGPAPEIFQELRQPPAYYWLCAAALRGARAIGISADPYTDPEGALRVMRGVSLALSLGVVMLAWASAALLWRGRNPWLRLLLPLGVALFPMRAFVDATVNNDVLAELGVSALFVVVAALLRWPIGWRGVALAALAVAVTAAGSPTKGTAPAASVPLLALSLLLWLGVLVTKLVERWRDRRDRRRGREAREPVRGRAWAIGTPVSMALLTLLVVSGLALSSFERRDEAVGWQTRFSLIERVNRVATSSRFAHAHEGSYVIELGAQGSASVSQALLSLAHHPVMSLTITGWARLSPSAAVTQSATATARVQVSLREGQRIAASSEVSLDSAGAWTPVSVDGKLTDSAEQVLMKVTASSGGPGAPVQIDDFSLKVSVPEGALPEPASRPVLLNPSAEEAAVNLRSWAARLLPMDARQMADVIVNPQIFDKGELSAYYAKMEKRSFWGLFGWVSIPLPEALYTLLDVLALLALGGLFYTGARRLGRWSSQEWLGLVSLSALAGAALIGFAKQMMFLATLNSAAYPQGRYLFVLIVPVIWLLIAGWGGLWSLFGRLYGLDTFHRLRHMLVNTGSGAAAHVPTRARPVSLPWGVWLLLVGLGLFNLYSLLALLGPYYYG